MDLDALVSELDMGMGFLQQHPPRRIALEHMLYVRFMGCDFTCDVYVMVNIDCQLDRS